MSAVGWATEIIPELVLRIFELGDALSRSIRFALSPTYRAKVVGRRRRGPRDPRWERLAKRRVSDRRRAALAAAFAFAVFCLLVLGILRLWGLALESA